MPKRKTKPVASGSTDAAEIKQILDREAKEAWRNDPVATAEELQEAFPGAKVFIKDQVLARATMAQARAEFARRYKRDEPAVIAARASAAAANRPTEPKALAEWEWDNEPARREGFSTRARYVAVRSRELDGTFSAGRQPR